MEAFYSKPNEAGNLWYDFCENKGGRVWIQPFYVQAGFWRIYVCICARGRKGGIQWGSGEARVWNGTFSGYLKQQSAFYTASCPLYRSFPGKGVGGAGDWAAEYVCAYNYHDSCQKICGKREQKSICYRAGRSGQPYNEGKFSKYCGFEVYCQYGISSGQHRRRRGGMEDCSSQFLPWFKWSGKEGGKRTGVCDHCRRGDGWNLWSLRKKYGHQIWSSRQISGLSRFPWL